MIDMMKKIMTTMDTSKEVAILVHLRNGKILSCFDVSASLYIWKPEHNCNLLNNHISSYSFLNLVSENKSNCTKHELVRINIAKKLYGNSGMPGYKKFFHALENNLTRECPLIVDNANICLNVYSKAVKLLLSSRASKLERRLPRFNK